MLSLRVSATDIDALRYFHDDEEADLDDLLAQLRRQTPPTPAMLAGTAFHKALETFDQGVAAELEADGHVFVLDFDGELDMPDFREIKATKDYLVGDVLVTLVGKVDAVLGRRIDDHKLTGSYDAERYLSSYQWRIYLEMFGADEFRWNVFEGAERVSQPTAYEDTHDHPDTKVWKVRSLHKLRMHRYPGMRDDVRSAVEDFVQFARQHLPEKLERIAA